MRIISEFGEMQQAQKELGKRSKANLTAKPPIAGHPAFGPTTVPGLCLLELTVNKICREKGHAKDAA